MRYRLSEADTLEKLNESGEFKASGVTESMAKTSIATYGRMFSITRQAIINDDMGALQQLPAIYGAAARRMINKMVYKMLKAYPTARTSFRTFCSARSTEIPKELRKGRSTAMPLPIKKAGAIGSCCRCWAT